MPDPLCPAFYPQRTNPGSIYGIHSEEELIPVCTLTGAQLPNYIGVCRYGLDEFYWVDQTDTIVNLGASTYFEALEEAMKTLLREAP